MPQGKIIFNGAIEIPLWPASSNISASDDKEETLVERSTDPAVNDRAISDVLSPSLFMFKPAKPNGSAMLIAPGGAYHRISIDKEGLDIAQWLNAIGITAFVLKYRMPGKNQYGSKTSVSVDDAVRAMRIIRYNADDYGISPERIGAMGFSAGGHILARMSCCPCSAGYASVDDADIRDFIPSLIVLMYPLVTLSNPHTHKISREILLGEIPDEDLEKALSIHCNLADSIPPVFIGHAQDDKSVSVENSILLYRALHEKGVSVDMHLFQKGGHGFGIHKALGLPVEDWTGLCERWMKRNGFAGS